MTMRSFFRTFVKYCVGTINAYVMTGPNRPSHPFIDQLHCDPAIEVIAI